MKTGVRISNNNTFGSRYRLSKNTIKAIEKSTKLTYDEMTQLTIDESAKLMKARGALKKSSKLQLWLQSIYKKIGEKTGLLRKEYNFHTDID